jgi:SAM-dependent methyltransferase
MCFRVLKSWEQNLEARHRLARSGLGYWPKRCPVGWTGMLQGIRSVPVGDLYKSWDVLLTYEAIQKEAAPTDHIIDLGAFASEVLCVLASAGYTNLTGIDFNPLVRHMPFRDRIAWRQGDMTRTGLPPETASAIVAISSIEHGHYLPVLKEVARLLKPGGLFIGSTDYWPDKIDTSDIKMFDLSWTILSTDDVATFVADAASLGLHPTGTIETAASERCVYCEEKLYTFGWFSLRKTAVEDTAGAATVNPRLP